MNNNIREERMPVGADMMFVRDVIFNKLKILCLFVFLILKTNICFAWDVPAQVFLCPGATSVDVEIEMPGSASSVYEWFSDKDCKSSLGDGTLKTIDSKYSQKSVFVRKKGTSEVKEVKIGNFDYIGIDNIVQGNSGYLCIGGSVELNPVENYNGRLENKSIDVNDYVDDCKYEWIYDGEMVGDSKIYNARKSGTYTLRFSNNGCVVKKTVVVEEEKKLLQISGSDAICNGGSLVLEVGGMDKYEWKGNVSLIDGSKKVRISSAGGYTVVGTTTIGGCKDSITFKIKEKEALDVKIDGVYALCPGSTNTVLTAYVAGVPSNDLCFLWYDEFGLPFSEEPSITVEKVGTYKVTVSDENCEGANNVNVDVVSNVGPVTLKPEGEVIICAGQKASVTGGGTNLISFRWYGPDGNEIIGKDDKTVEINKEGFYHVQGYTTEGCPSEREEFKARVVDNPGLILPELKPCEGDTAELRAQSADSLKFVWIPPTPDFASYNNSKKILVSKDGTFKATVTDLVTKCQTTTSVDIKFLPLPTITGKEKEEICEGSETILSFTTVKDGKLTGVPKTYTWTDEKGNKLSVGDSTLKVSRPGKYIFSAENAYGCTSKNEVIVSVKPTGDIDISKDKNYLCSAGETAKFTASGNEISSYKWYLGSAFKGQDAVLEVKEAGTYKLTATLKNGCSVEKTVSIETKAQTHIDTVIPKFCKGQTGRIVVTSDKESDYEWADGANTNYKDVTESGDYVVKITDHEFNCSQNVTVKVTALDTPAISITPAKYVLCEGSSVTLKALAGTSTDKVVFAWVTPSSSAYSISVSSAGTYKATATSEITGCKSNAAAVVNVTPPPTVKIEKMTDVICEGEDINLTGKVVEKDTGAVSYEWTGPKNFKKTNLEEKITNATINHSGKYILTARQNNCVVKDSVDVEVKNMPKVTFKSLPASSICSDFKFTFENNMTVDGDVSDITSSQWIITPSTNVKYEKNNLKGDILFSDPNTYEIKLVYYSACGTDSVIGKLTIDAQLSFSIEAKDSICEGEDLTIKSHVDTDKQVVYEWNGPNGITGSNADLTVNNVTTMHQGEYSLSLQNGACKTEAQKVNVTVVEKTKLKFENLPDASNRVCGTFSFKKEENLKLVKGKEADITSVKWSVQGPENGAVIEDDKKLSTGIEFNESGNYEIKLIYDTWCGEDSVIGKFEIDAPIEGEMTSEKSFDKCEGDSVSFVTTYPEDVKYTWTGPNWKSDKKDPTTKPLKTSDAGKYTLVVSRGACKTDVQEITIDVKVVPVLSIEGLPTETNRVCGSFDFNYENNVKLVSGDRKHITSQSWIVTRTDGGPLDGVKFETQSTELETRISFNEHGKYKIALYYTTECGNDSVVKSFEIDEPIEGGMTSPLNFDLCEGDSLQLSTSYPKDVTFLWTGPDAWTSSDSMPLIKNIKSSATGKYSLLVTRGACSTKEQFFDVNVKVVPTLKIHDLPSDTKRVCGSFNFTSEKNVSLEKGKIEHIKSRKWSIKWNDAPVTSETKGVTLTMGNNVMDDAITFDTAGVFFLDLEYETECGVFHETATFEIDAPIRVSVESGRDVWTCEGRDLEFKLSSLEKAKYSWSTSADAWTSSDANPVREKVTPEMSGIYTVKITRGACEIDPININVLVKKIPKITMQNLPDDKNGVCGSFIFQKEVNTSIYGDTSDITSMQWSVSPETEIDYGSGKNNLTDNITFNRFGTYTIEVKYETVCGTYIDSGKIVIDEPIDLKLDKLNDLCANIRTEQNQNPVDLVANPSGGVWTSIKHPDWIKDGKIYPNSPDTFEVYYEVHVKSCSASDKIMVTIKDYPKIDLNGDVSVCSGQTESIELEAEPNSGSWSGSGVKEEGEKYFYYPPIEIGSYVVNYLYTDDKGCKSLGDKNIHVLSVPSPNFGPDRACLPSPTEFNTEADASNSFWYVYGDGTQDETGVHLYPIRGLYNVKLVVTGGNGCRDSLTKQVEINEIPSAKFELDTLKGCSPLPVNAILKFDYADSLDVTYTWNIESKGERKDHSPFLDTQVFTATVLDSIYTIGLKAENFCGTDFHEDSVYVIATPKADFEIEADWECAPVLVKFQNKTKGVMEGLSYLWNFDDGDSSELRFPEHTFLGDLQQPVVYNVRLVALNQCGSDTIFKELKVLAQQVKAQFENKDKIGCVGQEVCFRNNSVGISLDDKIDQVSWSFGNESVSKNWDGCVTYEEPGDYHVVMTVNNKCSQDKYESDITIYERPQILKMSAPVYACIGDTVAPTFEVDMSLHKVEWNFGDGLYSDQTNPYHKYKSDSTYTISLMVEADNIASCKSFDSIQILIPANPNPLIEPLQMSDCSPLEYAPTFDDEFYYLIDYEGKEEWTSSLSHTYENNGSEPLIYSVPIKIQNQYGCQTVQYGLATVFPTPKAYFIYEITVGRPEIVTMYNESERYDRCEWRLPYSGTIFVCDSIKEEFYNNDEQELSLMVENQFRCQSVFSITHKPMMKGLYFPNTFIPGDINEEVATFNGVGIGIKEYLLEIFDLYGNLIYSTSSLNQDGSPDQGWDGKDAHGKLMPQDVYTWRARALYEDGSVYPFGNSVKGEETYQRGSVLLLIK